MDKKEKFGRYYILEHINTGGMASVYKVQNSSGRTFAVKSILEKFYTNEKFMVLS